MRNYGGGQFFRGEPQQLANDRHPNFAMAGRKRRNPKQRRALRRDMQKSIAGTKRLRQEQKSQAHSVVDDILSCGLVASKREFAPKPLVPFIVYTHEEVTRELRRLLCLVRLVPGTGKTPKYERIHTGRLFGSAQGVLAVAYSAETFRKHPHFGLNCITPAYFREGIWVEGNELKDGDILLMAAWNTGKETSVLFGRSMSDDIKNKIRKLRRSAKTKGGDYHHGSEGEYRTFGYTRICHLLLGGLCSVGPCHLNVKRPEGEAYHEDEKEVLLMMTKYIQSGQDRIDSMFASVPGLSRNPSRIGNFLVKGLIETLHKMKKGGDKCVQELFGTGFFQLTVCINAITRDYFLELMCDQDDIIRVPYTPLKAVLFNGYMIQHRQQRRGEQGLPFYNIGAYANKMFSENMRKSIQRIYEDQL